jgi:hypothetical protein
MALVTAVLAVLTSTCVLRGASWPARVDAGFFGVIVSPTDPPLVLSHHRGGWSSSPDEGRTWTPVAPYADGDPIVDLRFQPVAPFEMFGRSNRGVRVMSLDGGRSWTETSRRAGTPSEWSCRSRGRRSGVPTIMDRRGALNHSRCLRAW